MIDILERIDYACEYHRRMHNFNFNSKNKSKSEREQEYKDKLNKKKLQQTNEELALIEMKKKLLYSTRKSGRLSAGRSATKDHEIKSSFKKDNSKGK
jgi:hypothetical protein